MNNAVATIIELASSHIGKGSMVSSAQLCLDDARALVERGNHHYAAKRAIKSLAYSVGGFHVDHAQAERLAATI